jgi:hypothetical protein
VTQAGAQVVVAAQAVDGAAFETPGGGRATVDPDDHNATRIAVIAVLVAAGSIASDVLPAIAGDLVISRIGWSRFAEASAQISLAPLLAVPILLALAQAFRRGTELAADAEGLV